MELTDVTNESHPFKLSLETFDMFCKILQVDGTLNKKFKKMVQNMRKLSLLKYSWKKFKNVRLEDLRNLPHKNYDKLICDGSWKNTMK
jgi:hypothetical protein